MLKKCTAAEKETLKKYLEQESEYNTFLLADIDVYGFENECQDVWMEWEEETCKAVYLRFYSNLLVYSADQGVNPASMETILNAFPIAVIMGKASALKESSSLLSEQYRCVEKQLFRLSGTEKLWDAKEEVLTASEKDVDEIFEFLAGIPQIRALYTSKEMIRDRIVSGDGVHMMIRKDQKIIAHGNSTTEAEKTAMIGGVATDELFRNKGYASQVVSELCKYILNRGKTPCLFSDSSVQPFFETLGFDHVGGWSTLERK